MVSGIVKVEKLLYPVLVKPNCLDCSRYEEFVKMSEAHAEDLSGMVRLMIGFFCVPAVSPMVVAIPGM